MKAGDALNTQSLKFMEDTNPQSQNCKQDTFSKKKVHVQIQLIETSETQSITQELKAMKTF